MGSWELMQDGKYAEAVAAFSQELANDPAKSALNNRGLAYLHLGNYDAALADFEAWVAQRYHDASQLTGPMPGNDRDLSGVAHWLAGRYVEAAQVWTADVEARLAGESRYGDAAGGVSPGLLVWFAGVRLGNRDGVKLATRYLRKRLRTKQSAAWPGPIARYLLGKLTEAEVLAAVTTGSPILRERQMCEARFYFGVQALSQGNEAAYRSEMQAAYKFGSDTKLENEYYLALHERA